MLHSARHGVLLWVLAWIAQYKKFYLLLSYAKKKQAALLQRTILIFDAILACHQSYHNLAKTWQRYLLKFYQHSFK